MEYLGEHGLGVRIINADTAGRYRLVIEVITDPHQACLLLDGRLEGDSELLRRLHLYILLAPHIEVAGWGNNGTVARIAGASFSPRTKKAHGWHSPRPRHSRAAHAVTSAPLTDGRIWRTTSEWTTRLPPRLTAISR